MAQRAKPPTARKKPSKSASPGRTKRATASKRAGGFQIPRHRKEVHFDIAGHSVKLTNLGKVFWPDLGITKGDLLQYYADISPVLLPHLLDRAMVMKRYPNGIEGKFFFMKHAPESRPDWIDICPIEHEGGNVIDFPVVQDLAALLWIVNLGCIDLNQWYARCDDMHRPDYLHFDLDPVAAADFAKVREAALIVHETLESLQLPSYAKTTGARGIHLYVPIERGPTQKEVWNVAKVLAQHIAARHPKRFTLEMRVAKRPAGAVLVDYNQNAWGRTLASVYSVRPKPRATVSMPVTWEEIAKGIEVEDFRMDNARARIQEKGDLWKPLLAKRGRARLEKFA